MKNSSHFVGLSEFSPPILSDALRACQDYLRMVHEYDPRARYCGIMWNYLPPMDISDAGNATLLGDTRMSIKSPEFICEELRPFF